jgi:hypothetical protein
MDVWIRLQTLADERGQKLFAVKRSLVKNGYTIHQVVVNGQPRDAVSIHDAEQWKAGLNTRQVKKVKK